MAYIIKTTKRNIELRETFSCIVKNTYENKLPVQIGKTTLIPGQQQNFDLTKKQIESYSKKLLVTILPQDDTTVNIVNKNYTSSNIDNTLKSGYTLTPDDKFTYPSPISLYIRSVGVIRVLDPNGKVLKYTIKTPNIVLPIKVLKIFKTGTNILDIVGYYLQESNNTMFPSWTPAALSSNIVAWFQKQSNNTYKDLSGENHTFTGPDSNGQYFSDKGWTVTQPFTLAVSYTENAVPNAYQILIAGDAANSSNTRAGIFTRFNNGYPRLLGTGSVPFSNAPISANKPHGVIGVFNGADSLASIDGKQYTSLNVGVGNIINGIRTGGGDGGSYYNGLPPNNIIIITGVISSDDMLRLEGWLARNGGSVTDLTDKHPFFTTAPTTGPIPIVPGSIKAKIVDGTNIAILGAYPGYGATNNDGSSSIPPMAKLFKNKAIQTVKVFGSSSAQNFGNGNNTQINNGETVETSIIYALSLLKNRGLQINLTIPLATGSNSYYQFPGCSLADAASGAADKMFVSVANAVINNGFADNPLAPPMIVYPQEQNGGSFPWGSDGSTNWNTNYIAACRRMFNVMKPIFTAANKKVLFGNAWNKGKPGLPWQRLELNYVGDAYCDFIGMDVYDDDYNYNLPQGYTGATGGNTAQTPAQRFQTSVLGGINDYCLTWLDAFARTPYMRGETAPFIDKVLPIVIGEWGAGGPTSIQNNPNDPGRPYSLAVAYSGGDDGYYTAQMLKWFKDHNVYAHYFYDIFDTSIGYTGAVKWTHENTGMSTSGYASTTANTLSKGDKTYTVGASLPFVVGMPLIIRDDSAPTTKFIEASVKSYSGTTLVVNGFAFAGTGTPTSVKIYTHPNAEMPNSYAAIQAASF